VQESGVRSQVSWRRCGDGGVKRSGRGCRKKHCASWVHAPTHQRAVSQREHRLMIQQRACANTWLAKKRANLPVEFAAGKWPEQATQCITKNLLQTRGLNRPHSTKHMLPFPQSHGELITTPTTQQDWPMRPLPVHRPFQSTFPTELRSARGPLLHKA